jgi:hypothetical protein
MLPVRMVEVIDRHRMGTSWSRSAIIWDLIYAGIKTIDPKALQERRHPIALLRAIALELDPILDPSDTSLGVLRGYGLSTIAVDRTLVRSIAIDGIGDNPSYSLRLRKLVRLGVDRLITGV